MREFIFKIPFNKGIRPHKNVPVGAGYLERAVGVLVGQDHLYGHFVSRIYQALPDDYIFSTTYGAFRVAVSERSIYLIKDSRSDAVRINLDRPITGTLWSCLDFGKYVALCSDTETIVMTEDYNPDRVLRLLPPLYPGATVYCRVGGRVVCGGFSKEGRRNWVAWTDIGSLRFTPSEASSEEQIDLLELNTSGSAPMEWPGDVLAIVPMESTYGKKGAIVYGVNGITFMYEASVEPMAIATFGFKTVSRAGILSRLAVARTHLGHVFLDTHGNLSVLQEDLSIKELGYRFIDYGSGVFYDKNNRITFITSPIGYTYALTDYGLTQTAGHLVNAAIVDRELILFGSMDINLYYRERYVKSEPIDFGWPGVKKVEGIRFDGVVPEGGPFRLEVESNMGLVEKQLMPHLTKNNWVYIGLSGETFTFRVWHRGYYYSRMEIRNLEVGVKFLDKRFVRGIGYGHSEAVTRAGQ